MYHIGLQMREFHLALEKYMSKLALDYDLEYLDGPQGAVLMYLMKHKDEDVVQKDIEQFLNIKNASASTLIKRMEKNQFVCVQASKEDKRFKIIEITPLGKEKYAILQSFTQALEMTMVQNITSEEVCNFYRVIEKMKANISVEDKTKEEANRC